MAAEHPHAIYGFEHEMRGISSNGENVAFLSPEQETLEDIRGVAAKHAAIAGNLRAVIDTLPGDVDHTIAEFVRDTYLNANALRTEESEEEAVIADQVAIQQITQGVDADASAHALGKQHGEVLQIALSEAALTESEAGMKRVSDAISLAEKQQSESRSVEHIDTARVVTELLKKNPEVRDTYERPRPTYEIAGRKVVFRNRMEIVDIPGSTVTVVAAASVQPLSIASFRKQAREQYQPNMTELTSFNQNHANDGAGNVLSVPNTPLGIVEAAIMLGARDLTPLRDKLLQGEYTDPVCEKLIDGILGVTSVDDTGKALDRYDTDGFAVMLSSLTGDETSRRIVETKSSALLRLEEERKQHNQEKAQQYLRERQENRDALPEPLPLERMFVVHSTSHELEFDDRGNAIFKPSGQYEDIAVLPRATWHVTINSGVYAHPQAVEHFGAQNRLVVAALTDVIHETPDRLEVLEGVDTWFVMSPGEEVKVPSPTVIEPTTNGEQLVQRDGDTIRFLLKEQYNEEEQRKIRLFADMYGAISIDNLKGKDTLGADTLKEACLQMVLSEKGLSYEERDRPATDGHGMASHHLAQRVLATAYRLGLRSGTHFNHVEKTFEEDCYAQVTTNLAQKLFRPYNGGAYTATSPEYGTAIGARRQALVNGCLPAAPQIVPSDFEQDLWV